MSNTKDFIIDQAYRLFLSRSYEAVSISDISKAIDLTKGALYHHFTNKEELFKAVIDKYLFIEGTPENDENITLLAFTEMSVAHAKTILNSIVSSTEKFIPINYLSLFIDALRHYPKFASQKQIFISIEVEKIKKVLKDAIKSKEIRGDIDISLTAFNYFSITYGLANNLLQNNSAESAIQFLNAQLLEMYKVLKLEVA